MPVLEELIMVHFAYKLILMNQTGKIKLKFNQSKEKKD